MFEWGFFCGVKCNSLQLHFEITAIFCILYELETELDVL